MSHNRKRRRRVFCCIPAQSGLPVRGRIPPSVCRSRGARPAGWGGRAGGCAVPRIFDNIDEGLLPALRETLRVSERADFCVGYFNLRGWQRLDDLIERWSGAGGACCRLLVGMQRIPREELQTALSLLPHAGEMDNQTASRLKARVAQEFRDQLTLGAPTNADEAGLRRLSAQLRAGKVVVKLFLRYPLHAKLYLAYRTDPNNPITGFLGSSNLTFAGLARQGELNVDVLDHDACAKLRQWFKDRWDDRLCVDISAELAAIIDASWARPDDPPPYHLYLKMAYHLAREARAGLAEFGIPPDLDRLLFDYQKAAVKIAAHHVKQRGGVLIGDVVGLGKTLMATTLARMFEESDQRTLIICPKNLLPMWQDYVDRYVPSARVKSLTTVATDLPELRRFPIVLIDESQNLRNREGKRYKAIQEYITINDSKCILLSATPYNKTHRDLSAQLRLFVPENADLGIRPERILDALGEVEFVRRHQCPVRSLAAFEKSEYPDDWRDLMRLYLIRRTRGFIRDNYAAEDPITHRKYLPLADGTRAYFPDRAARTIAYPIEPGDPDDQYARLFAAPVEETVNALSLPRYGLGNYVAARPASPPTSRETEMLRNLSHAGKRLMGFCRTNLFKRLESGGAAFVQSIERHILRNFVYLHAIEHDLPLPIGTQDAASLDTRVSDEDADATLPSLLDDEEDETAAQPDDPGAQSEAAYRARAAEIYAGYAARYRRKFAWLRPALFVDALADDLRADARALLAVRARCGAWDAGADRKLAALAALLTEHHPTEKVLVFTQFADTVRYLTDALKARGVAALAGVTGDDADPTALAWRFSPRSNGKQIPPADELRVLIATDVLSEGQNLQDGAIVVNYDLPWAIIRLIQRAGRVDRIGQRAERILCYSFLPADGVERIIRLRGRVRQRLQENAEVIGTDEAFFDDDRNDAALRDLFTEKSNIYDADDEGEVDLTSYAYQIWKNATDADPSLAKKVTDLPDVVYSTRAHAPTWEKPEGVLVYTRTAAGNDALAWVNEHGQSITESQLTILRAAECAPDTPAIPRHARHHDLVQRGGAPPGAEERAVGGQLGRPSGARFRTYERLKQYAARVRGTLFDTPELRRAIDDIYRFTLYQSATDLLNQLLKRGATDRELADCVVALRHDERLCIVEEDGDDHEPRIICSLGLFVGGGR